MSDERPVCPSCNQELISYRDSCGICGWQGTPVEVKQQGLILRDLGDKFEIALNDGSVAVYSKLYVYPSADQRQSSYPLEKSKKRIPSGTLYSYTVTRRNKKGIAKQYQYWAYSYEVKDPKTGQWKTKKKSVSRGKRERVSNAISLWLSAEGTSRKISLLNTSFQFWRAEYSLIQIFLGDSKSPCSRNRATG